MQHSSCCAVMDTGCRRVACNMHAFLAVQAAQPTRLYWVHFLVAHKSAKQVTSTCVT